MLDFLSPLIELIITYWWQLLIFVVLVFLLGYYLVTVGFYLFVRLISRFIGKLVIYRLPIIVGSFFLVLGASLFCWFNLTDNDSVQWIKIFAVSWVVELTLLFSLIRLKYLWIDPLRARLFKKSSYAQKARSRTIPQVIKDQVWKRDRGACVKCGSKKSLEFDHIYPFSKGGQHRLSNLQLLCKSCNRKKSARIN